MFLRTSFLVFLVTLLQAVWSIESPYNQTIRGKLTATKRYYTVYWTINLDRNEEIDNVKWKKVSGVQKASSDLLEYIRNHDPVWRTERDDFLATVNVTNTVANITFRQQDSRKTSTAISIDDEGGYLMEVHTSENEIRQYYFDVQLSIATQLTMQFSPERKVGEKATVWCHALEWKPPARFLRLRRFGDRYQTGSYEHENAMILRPNYRTPYPDILSNVTAEFNFTVTNADRDVRFMCSAWNEATGTTDVSSVTLSLTVEAPYNPQVGDPCLYPPNFRSQCHTPNPSGVGCYNGACVQLQMRSCILDERCGHDKVSKFQCINGTCQCDPKIFYFEWTEPYCRPIVGRLCEGEYECTTASNTKCTENACACDSVRGTLSRKTVRGQIYQYCQAYIGRNCTSSGACKQLNNILVCRDDQCGCPTNVPDCLSSTDEIDSLVKTEKTSKKLGMYLIFGGVATAFMVGALALVSYSRSINRDPVLADDKDKKVLRVKERKRKQFRNIQNTKSSLSIIKGMSDSKIKQWRRKDRDPSKSRPERKLSTKSLSRFRSAGKRQQDGPDYGESSTDSLVEYIEMRIKENRKKRKKQLEKSDTSTKSEARPKVRAIADMQRTLTRSRGSTNASRTKESAQTRTEKTEKKYKTKKK